MKFISYNESKNELTAINLENGKEFQVDPFVGCAFDYKKANELIGNIYKGKGHFHEDGCFLIQEGEFNFIQ